MAPTLRSRVNVTASVPLQTMNSTISQVTTQSGSAHNSGTSPSATSPSSPSSPVTTPPSVDPQAQQAIIPSPTTLAPPGSPQVGTSTSTSPSQTASPTPPPNNTQLVTTTGSSSPAPTASDPPQVGPAKSKKPDWYRKIEWLNSPTGWAAVILALIFGILTYTYGIKVWVLSVWSAHNDFRDACLADRDNRVFSKACNETLSSPAAPPPFKRDNQDSLQTTRPALGAPEEFVLASLVLMLALAFVVEALLSETMDQILSFEVLDTCVLWPLQMMLGLVVIPLNLMLLCGVFDTYIHMAKLCGVFVVHGVSGIFSCLRTSWKWSLRIWFSDNRPEPTPAAPIELAQLAVTLNRT